MSDVRIGGNVSTLVQDRSPYTCFPSMCEGPDLVFCIHMVIRFKNKKISWIPSLTPDFCVSLSTVLTLEEFVNESELSLNTYTFTGIVFLVTHLVNSNFSSFKICGKSDIGLK